MRITLITALVVLTGCAAAFTPGTWIVTTTDLAASTVTVECNAPSATTLCDLNDVSIYDLAVGACGEIGFSDAEHFRTRIERPGGNTLAGIHVMSYECTDED